MTCACDERIYFDGISISSIVCNADEVWVLPCVSGARTRGMLTCNDCVHRWLMLCSKAEFTALILIRTPAVLARIRLAVTGPRPTESTEECVN